MKISKLIAALMFIVITLSCFGINTFAADATIAVSSVRCNTGETVQVPISISNNSGLTDIQFNVNFDSLCLEYLSCETTSDIFALASTTNSGNKLSYSAMNADQTTDNGILLTITFKVISDERLNSEITISDILANDFVTAKNIEISNGKVSIGGSFVSTTESTTKQSIETTTVQTIETSTVRTTEASTEITTRQTTTEHTTAIPTFETTTQHLTETNTEATTKVTEFATTSATTTTKKSIVNNDYEVDTETTTKSGGKSSSKASNNLTSKSQTEVTTEATSINTNENRENTVSVIIGENKLYKNGIAVIMDAAAYIQPSSNSTMIPLRFVSTAIAEIKGFNATVSWESKTKTAKITYQNHNISFTAGSNTMYVNGNPVVMENGVKAEINNDRMYIPFRALGNAMDINVSWDAQSKTAIYK